MAVMALEAPGATGPPRSTRPPESWRRDVDDYLLTLAAAGQRPATIRTRYGIEVERISVPHDRVYAGRELHGAATGDPMDTCHG